MRVVVLGAGFGGLELSSRLSEALGEDADVTLIDRTDAFMFGFAKLDVMFGVREPSAVRLPYARIAKPGVRFVRETIVAIDPEAKRVTTDGGTYDADVLVIALGADLVPEATPGLAETGNEFYTEDGAERLRSVLPAFTGGDVVVGVCGEPFKCPPAPSEAALLTDAYLRARGLRDTATITLVMPFGVPIPPSPEMSQALLGTFAERGIAFAGGHRVRALEGGEVVVDDGSRLPCDLFLGIPVHAVPPVVAESGLAVDGWVPVDPGTLETRFPGVYAVGDVTSVGTPKAGMFAEGAAKIVAEELVARARGGGGTARYEGDGTCYIEFGGGEVGSVDVNFLSSPGTVTATYHAPSIRTAEEKAAYAASRAERWFG
ncbi:MAG TPA: FAD-dependent oxidoreductase [Actinomycetota bacterium]|nr:FAD-dependent oxidoreductase [Actinomycetota bacterium]